VIENLNARIAAWWGMVVLLSIAFLAGRAGVVLLFALLSFAALREFLSLTAKHATDHWALAAGFFVILPLQYWLVWIDWYGFYSIFVPVYAFLLLPVLSALSGQTRHFLVRVAETQWALMICVFCISHVPALLVAADPRVRGAQCPPDRLADLRRAAVRRAAICLGQADRAPQDCTQPVALQDLGGVSRRHPLGQPGRRLALVDDAVRPDRGRRMCLVITLMGFFGGLVMSAIKRDKGVKDWGHLIAGHGGFIDRLDSVIFAAPIFFHLTRYWYSAT
jgi:phosphatidate cytidylyltransferase